MNQTSEVELLDLVFRYRGAKTPTVGYTDNEELLEFARWLLNQNSGKSIVSGRSEQLPQVQKLIDSLFELKRLNLLEAFKQENADLFKELQMLVSCSLPLPKDPFEFIADGMEKELRLRQMIDEWCISQFGSNDEALEKAEAMFIAARDTFYRQPPPNPLTT